MGESRAHGIRPAPRARGHADGRIRVRRGATASIYIRDEYPLAVERMNRAIDQCRERGIFGGDAFGTGVKFDAEVDPRRGRLRLR